MKKFEDYTIEELQKRIEELKEDEELENWNMAKKILSEMELLLDKIRDLGFDISVIHFNEMYVDILGFSVDDDSRTINVHF